MDSDGILSCEVNVEWTNKQGVVQRKVASKKAIVKLLRGTNQDIFIEITVEKVAPVKLYFEKNSQVHNKFMKEGKSSIRFPSTNATLFLSNAPPEKLRSFLKMIFIKMTNQAKPGPNDAKKISTPLRNQVLLHRKPVHYQEISPATDEEIHKAFRKASGKSSDTTPSPLAGKKRKLERISNDKAPASKKLYTQEDILDIEQKEVLDACLAGKNVFFTGSAGSGKSYLLRKIIGALPPDVTAATASTGVAACHIGGTTLHQFAGIGNGEASLERSVQLALKPPTVTMWRRTKHLIIDEVSMVDGSYFEKIEEVARRVRRNDKPFGGIQLILCGDFFQLPPIVRQIPGGKKINPRFSFQTPAWKQCRFATFELVTVHRQSDKKFINILNKIRTGRADEEVVEILRSTAKQNIELDGILATRLCSHTKDVDLINESRLKALKGEMKIFEAEDPTPGTTAQLNLQTPVSNKLELKIGAQVMLLKNINIAAGLVNGARGVIKEFKNGLPLVQFKNKKEYLTQREQWTIRTAGGASLTRKQIPLKLAWAFSIHKSQGLTLDCVEMSLGRVFEPGQAYVALSRAQSLEGLRVLDFKAGQVWANPDVLQFYKMFKQTQLIPLGVSNRNLISLKKNEINNNNNNNKSRKKLLFKSKLMMEKPIMTIS